MPGIWPPQDELRAPRCLVCDALDVLAVAVIVGVLLWVLVAP